jgi:hypothetical protein
MTKAVEPSEIQLAVTPNPSVAMIKAAAMEVGDFASNKHPTLAVRHRAASVMRMSFMGSG